jgi:KDO2-lipid IV(A) lauroyltransferase
MQRLSETFAYFAFQLGIIACRIALRLLPRSWLLALFRGLADAGFRLFRKFRERSTRNLSLAFGDQLEGREIYAVARDSLRNFFCGFIELGFAVESGLERIKAEVPVSGMEHLETALSKGKGAIILSGHLGNFLLLGTRLAAEGYCVYVLINQPRSGRIADLRRRYRNKIGQRTIHARPRKEASRKLLQVLRRNEIAIMIADEFRSGTGIYAPFFGRTVLARRGPATLALRTGAAVVPACLVRNPAGELGLVIEPEIKLSRTGKIKTDIIQSTVQMTQWLEKTVRSYPDQWNWMTIHWQDGAKAGQTVGTAREEDEESVLDPGN